MINNLLDLVFACSCRIQKWNIRFAVNVQLCWVGYACLCNTAVRKLDQQLIASFRPSLLEFDPSNCACFLKPKQRPGSAGPLPYSESDSILWRPSAVAP